MIRRIAAAVALVDGYTGRRLTGSEARVIVTGGPRPVRKDDGWFVIWDNGLPYRHLIVESPYFETRELELDVAALWRKKQPSLRVWMIPGSCYPYPPGLHWTEERAKPGEILEGILDGSVGILKLTEDYSPKTATPLEITVKCSSEVEPEGIPFVIRNRDGTGAEPLSLWEMTDRGRGTGILERPLRETHKVKDTEICLRWQAVTGADGICRLPEFCTLWNRDKETRRK